MKVLIITLVSIIMSINFTAHSQAVVISSTGASPDGSAMLDIQSNAKGILIPRLDSLQRVSISNPAEGLLVYDQTSKSFWFCSAAIWHELISDSNVPFKHLWGMGISGDVYRSGGVALGSYLSASGYGLNAQNFTAARGAIRGADQFISYLYAEGRLGVQNWGNGLNLPIHVQHTGVLGLKYDNAGGEYGSAVYGWNNDNEFQNYGGVLIADGEESGENIGLYARADNGNTNFAGRFEGRVNVQGNYNSADVNEPLLQAIVNHGNDYHTRAIFGQSIPQPGKGHGVFGEGGNVGVYAWGNGTTSNSYSYGVLAFASGTGVGTRIGLYGSATGGATNWAGYFNGGNVYINNDLRIGTTDAAAGYKVSVDGKIACEEVLVQYNFLWPDYVFDDDYDLMSISDLEAHLKKQKHLPGIPSSAEISEKGISLGEMQASVIQKLEELTLYIIEMEKEIEALKKENVTLKEAINFK